jgi:hypothetical protein
MSSFGTRKRELDKDTYSVQGDESSESVRVKGIVLLSYGDAFAVTQQTRVAAVSILSNNSFCKLGRMTDEARRSHLRDCVAIAALVPLIQVARPKSLAYLAATANAIEEELSRL